MEITLRFIGLNLSPVPKSYCLTLDSRATVRQALEAMIAQTGQSLDLERLVSGVLLVEGKRVYADSVLRDQDILTVLRTLEGG